MHTSVFSFQADFSLGGYTSSSEFPLAETVLFHYNIKVRD